MNDHDAVWITGIGTATPLGLSYAELADNLLAGRSGVGPVEHFDPRDQPCRVAGVLPRLTAPEGMPRPRFERLGPWEQLLVHCGFQALRDAGWSDRVASARIGLVIGIGSEWLLWWEANASGDGSAPGHPAADRTGLGRFLAGELGLNGPVATVAAACASGNIALAQARRWLQRGWVDLCLAGACDRSVTPMGMAGFGNLGALTKRNDAPTAASRPFDRDRDGFVMAEGGALFVLEPARSARRRGARPYGAIAGYGATSDAYHLVIPSPEPGPCIQALRGALAEAGVSPEAIDYINAHATSTPVGDRFEAAVIRAVLGSAARRVPVSSTKSMTGHLLSAAAAVEAIACLVAFERSALPPTINLDHPDPDCDLCHVAHQPRAQRVAVAVSNSFGFGGSNTCLVLRKIA